MEYQQFVIQCYWNNYERRHGIEGRLTNDDEAMLRGLRESARHARKAARTARKNALDRAIAFLRLNSIRLACLRLIRRAPRVVA